eukprot:gnl/MRDRNA2_/MRDRNA2_93347_c0_seq1.p1 gnl/MRDRNA2_/MRDRNA2_93347_c0~~gnl/MRDRNA2_/MRDRNA2_93347_c0_seq1.p1  ORF type:complete len:645 (+),score=121.62 gnl/MRDRNA2_/MRDRNA2_93347_c0_seq1:132-2066(+)
MLLGLLLLVIPLDGAGNPDPAQKAARLLVPRVQEIANASVSSDFFNTTLAMAVHASWSATITNISGNEPKKEWWKAFRKHGKDEKEEDEEEESNSEMDSWRRNRKKAAEKNLARRQAAARLREARKGQDHLDADKDDSQDSGQYASDPEMDALKRWSERMDGKKVKSPYRKRSYSYKKKAPAVQKSTKSLRGFGDASNEPIADEIQPPKKKESKSWGSSDSWWGSSASSESKEEQASAEPSATKKASKESNSSWSFPIPIPMSSTPSQPRVYFLFMVGDDIPNAELWRAFFANAGEEEWSAYVHCKSGCSPSIMAKLPGAHAVDMVKTYYCHDLVTAMVQLLRFSIKDGGHDNDKFVFVSDSTLPVKPFEEVSAALHEHQESDFCIFPSDHWAEADFENQRAYLIKHQQWVVLNREHAGLMVSNWDSVDSSGHWRVPVKDDHTYSPKAIYNASHFSRSPHANWCTDEWAFFATIFGAQVDDGSMTKVIPGYSGQHGNSLLLRGPPVRSMQGTCRTFAFFAENDGDMTMLAKSLAQDFPKTYLSCWPICHLHPASIERVSDGGLLEMRSSPFLFVRKFGCEVELHRFKRIILAEYPPDDIQPAGAYIAPSSSRDLDVSSHDWDLIDDSNNGTYRGYSMMAQSKKQ